MAPSMMDDREAIEITLNQEDIGHFKIYNDYRYAFLLHQVASFIGFHQELGNRTIWRTTWMAAPSDQTFRQSFIAYFANPTH